MRVLSKHILIKRVFNEIFKTAYGEEVGKMQKL